MFAWSQNTNPEKKIRELPAQFQVILPTFAPHIIDRDKKKIYQQLGSLSKLSSTTEKHNDQMEAPGAESSPPGRPLIESLSLFFKYQH